VFYLFGPPVKLSLAKAVAGSFDASGMLLHLLRHLLPHRSDHAGVAQVRAVFLEGQTHDQHPRAIDLDAPRDHRLDQLAGDIGAHAVVDPPPGQDHVRMIAQHLRLVRQVIGIDADAVPADKAGPEIEEIPFGPGGRQHRLGIDAHAVEDDRQLVDEGDVEIALGVLDHLGGFGHPDALARNVPAVTIRR
jgi:hypothetical protein